MDADKTKNNLLFYPRLSVFIGGYSCSARGRLRTEWLLAFGLWTLAGCAMSVQMYSVLSMTSKPVTWLQAFRHDLVYAWLWAAMTPAILFAIRRARRWKLAWYRVAPFHLAAACVFTFVHRLAITLLLPKPAPSGWVVSFWWNYLFYIDYGVIFYGLYLAVDSAAGYYRDYNENRLRASELERQLAQAQLQALRMQLDPHFLFNTLHTISSLVREDPDAAELILARLGDLLRASLANAQSHEVPLRQEMELLQKYLDIERTRFDDRLRVEVRLDPVTLNARVPNLILQPLVENAVRHGISKRPRGGTIRITSEAAGGRLVLRVADDGVGLPDGGISHNGVGLENTRARLERIYGDEQNFSVANASDGGVEAVIRIPLQPATPSANEDEYACAASSDRR